MKNLDAALLLVILASCGRQIVQFANTDVDGGNDAVIHPPLDAADDALGTDAPFSDAASDAVAIDAPVNDAPVNDAPLLSDAALDSVLGDALVADANPCAQAPVALGTTVNFAVLAGSTVTNTGPSMITGDLGVSPGTAVTGFGPGILVGSMHDGDPTAATAIGDLDTAYLDAKGRTLCSVSKSGNIGGQTLAPGLYTSTGSLAISSGQLTLDGGGDSNAVFIFQMASTLDTSPGLGVVLIGMAQAKNVFWQVGSSATIGTTSAMVGTIMADQAVTLKTGASLQGRALAHIAAVTLDTNNIVKQ